MESGIFTIRNTVPAVVTRATQDQEEIPTETGLTMSAGDSSISPPMSGWELRNAGTEEVILLASLIVPLPEGKATPGAGMPVP